MKISNRLLLLTVGLSYSLYANTAFAAQLSDSPIQKVTLYPGTAKIERSITVQAGEQLVTLSGLSANFDISQLQYQSSNIEINAVAHTDSALDKPAGRESKTLLDQIENLKQQISQQNAIIQAAQLQNTFLSNVTEGSPKNVREQAYDAFVAIDQAQQKVSKLQQHLAELQQDLGQIGDHQFNQRTLKFYVNAPQRGEIKISYMVPYARWQPMYKAELNTQTQQVRLTRMAMIAQKTGEDWNNVNLTLSTSTPTHYSQQMIPNNWVVDYYEPEPSHYGRTAIQAPPVAEVAPIEPMAMQKSMADQSPQFPQFQSTNLNFSTEFRSDTKASIGSSGQQIYLPLSAHDFAAKLTVWAIPRQSNQAVLNAEIAQMDQNWPTGIIKLYRDGDYVGQRQWSNSGETSTQLNFGVDDQIQVNVIDLNEKDNAIRSSRTETIQKQRYSVQNLHHYPIDLMLFDAEPQSQNSKLTAKTTYSLPPTATTWNNQPNINQWNMLLQPKQKFELNIQHQFNYPSKGNTSGF